LYFGLRLCIDTLCVIFVVVGVGFFSGTKRETLWDRENLVGLLLIGIALSAHGGVDTILRSSPHAVFSGYVLGFSRPSGLLPGGICLYDLDNHHWDPPYRCVYIPAGSKVPGAVWTTGTIWLLRATYRTRDLQAVRIEGEPVPSREATGLQAWTWQHNEPLLRPVIEASVGIILMLGAAIKAMIRRASPVSSSLHIYPRCR
jgi:hypothetical protein